MEEIRRQIVLGVILERVEGTDEEMWQIVEIDRTGRLMCVGCVLTPAEIDEEMEEYNG